MCRICEVSNRNRQKAVGFALKKSVCASSLQLATRAGAETASRGLCLEGFQTLLSLQSYKTMALRNF